MRIGSQPILRKQKNIERHTPHFQKLRKDLLKIVSWTWPTFYSKIDNITYVIVKSFKYVNREFFHHMHTISKWLYEEIFIKNVTKIAARYQDEA